MTPYYSTNRTIAILSSHNHVVCHQVLRGQQLHWNINSTCLQGIFYQLYRNHNFNCSQHVNFIQTFSEFALKINKQKSLKQFDSNFPPNKVTNPNWTFSHAITTLQNDSNKNGICNNSINPRQPHRLLIPCINEWILSGSGMWSISTGQRLNSLV